MHIISYLEYPNAVHTLLTRIKLFLYRIKIDQTIIDFFFVYAGKVRRKSCCAEKQFLYPKVDIKLFHNGVTHI